MLNVHLCPLIKTEVKPDYSKRVTRRSESITTNHSDNMIANCSMLDSVQLGACYGTDCDMTPTEIPLMRACRTFSAQLEAEKATPFKLWIMFPQQQSHEVQTSPQ